MTDEPTGIDIESLDTTELLTRVGVLQAGNPRRSDPLLDPGAFRELARRLSDVIDEPYDMIVVRDLVGDKMLGYQLALESGKPVSVSVNREGIVTLDRAQDYSGGGRALIAADLHFTPHSIQAARAGLETAGLRAIGVAMFLQLDEEDGALPLWRLESQL